MGQENKTTVEQPDEECNSHAWTANQVSFEFSFLHLLFFNMILIFVIVEISKQNN